MLTEVKCRTVKNLSIVWGFNVSTPSLSLSQLDKTPLSLFPSMVGFPCFLTSSLQWFLIKTGNASIMLSYFLNGMHSVPLCLQSPYTWVTHDLCILTGGRSKTRQNKIQWPKAWQVQTRRHIKSGWSGGTLLLVQFAQTKKERYFFYLGKLPCLKVG